MPVLNDPLPMTLYVTVNRVVYRVHRLVFGKRRGEIVAGTWRDTFKHFSELDLTKRPQLRAQLVAIFEAAEAEAAKQNLKPKDKPCPT
jgi:hypothetical protein